MSIEEQLRDKLEKVEALYFGAGTAGEKNAAEAAIERLRGETGGEQPTGSSGGDAVLDAGSLGRSVVRRPVSPLRAAALSLSPAEADDDHGAGAARVL